MLHVLRCQVADEHRGALAQRHDGIGLNLRIRGQHPLCKPGDDRLGEAEVLRLQSAQFVLKLTRYLKGG